MTATQTVGDHVRAWRQRRRLTQLDLALNAEISTRHLSFIETGRSQPSRDMVLHLSEQLQVPLRERNAILVAAGYAPLYPQRKLDAPELARARAAVDIVLKGAEPYPALAVDRHWQLVAANRMVAPLLAGIDEALLKPPVNVLRLSLHPRGLAPRIANLAQWRAHVLERLRRQVEATADAALIALMDELRGYPGSHAPPRETGFDGIVVPFEIEMPDGHLSFFSTTTIFGTPVDVTLAELALESFFPANEGTAQAMQRLARTVS